MKRLRTWTDATRLLFRRGASSEVSSQSATTSTQLGPASSVSGSVRTAGHDGVTRGAWPGVERWFKSPVAAGSAGFLGGGIVVGTLMAQGSFTHLERHSPKAATSLAPARQEGWSREHVERKEKAPPPATSAFPGLGPHFIADAAAKAAPAVVNVSVKPCKGSEYEVSSSGSGFILQAGGTIVTNVHVVRDALDSRAPPGNPTRGACPVLVSLRDGRTYEGRICSLDKASDLALVKIEAQEQLPVAELGSSSGLRVGEWILALGSPLQLQNTVTAGIVSCVERKAAELGLVPNGCEYIQMDAAINQGNSGGPVVNLHGQVVGISHTTALMSTGVSFAIPIDAAKHIIRQLEVQGRVRRPQVGMKLLELNAANAAQLRARDASFPKVSAGILVPSVSPGLPAHAAGLRAGDVIIGFAGGNTEREQLTTSRLVRVLGEHVDLAMQLQVLRPKAGPLSLEVTPKEAL